MRWAILRTLLYKEFLRHAANRGAIALVGLLVAASLLLSLFGKESAQATLMGGVQTCYIDYWEDGPRVQYLREHVPPELESRIVFRDASAAPTRNGQIVYAPGTAAIQIRGGQAAGARRLSEVHVWHAEGERGAILPFEAWFWKQSHNYLARRAFGPGALTDATANTNPAAAAAAASDDHSTLDGTIDPRSAIATSLVLFGLFFVCVYLLPSLTCEERERGVLLAQALTPASPGEILAARFLFYPVVGMALSALLAGIYQPTVLTRPFFWLALAVTAVGSMGIGLTIATLARTQRSASMASLCYLLVVAMVLVICQQCNIPVISWLALEYHCPRIMHAVMTERVAAYWGNLLAAAVLAACWACVAARLFRRYGWQ